MPAPALRLRHLVLDTNVVLDLLHFSDPGAMAILHALDSGRAQCHAANETLAEWQRVLGYPEFKLDQTAQSALYQAYRNRVIVAATLSTCVSLPRCRDPDDQMFLQLAAVVPADYLVTKDRALLELRHHHGLGFAIVTPAGASALLG
jgi:putative PIN family toxin of toxin-antitoxin system